MSQSSAATYANPASRPARSDRQTLREALNLLWTVADAYAKRGLLLALGLVTLGALLSALSPLALKYAVDALTQRPAGATLLAPVALVLLFVLGQYLVRFLTEVRTLVFGQADQRVRRFLGRELFDHLVRLPLRFHLERKAGAMGETAQQGIQGYQLLLNHMVYTILPVTVEFVAVAVVLVNMGHAKYLLILGIASLGYVAVFQRGAANIRDPARSISAAHIEAHAVMADSLVNFETVKYFDAEPVVSNRYDTALGRTQSAWRRFFRKRAVNGVLVATIFAASLATALVFAVHDVADGTMTVGALILINIYVAQLVQPLEQLGFAVRDMAQGLAFLEKMLDLFRETSEGDLRHAEPYSVEPLGALIFHNVTFSYRNDEPVLKGVSFFVPPGHTVAVVGVSGAGKSSLIRLLFRLYEPDCGRIVLDGIPVTELPLSTVRQAIAVVPQDTVLFHDTIANNIALGRRGSNIEDIKEAARIANLHDFIMSMPDAYETVVGERGLKLSGGERQRVAIARAALKRPRIFVFDEVTSSLDSKTEAEILRNLVDVSSKCTTLVIAQRLATIVHADEILVMDRGAIIERGTHAELQKKNGHYASLWQAQHGDKGSVEASVA